MEMQDPEENEQSEREKRATQKHASGQSEYPCQQNVSQGCFLQSGTIGGHGSGYT
jgi:hypothetical protein